MTSLTSYLLVILIVGIILLTITYTTDFAFPIGSINMGNFFDNSTESSSSCSNIEYEKNIKPQQQLKPNTNQVQNKLSPIQIQSNPGRLQTKEEPIDISSFLIDNNFDSDNINKQLFNYTEDFQMTENTGNAIANALADLA
jgi:hypothetical protein